MKRWRRSIGIRQKNVFLPMFPSRAYVKKRLRPIFTTARMLEALKQFRKEPEVRIKLSGIYTPIVIEAEGRSDFALVLPVRLREERAA